MNKQPEEGRLRYCHYSQRPGKEQSPYPEQTVAVGDSLSPESVARVRRGYQGGS